MNEIYEYQYDISLPYMEDLYLSTWLKRWPCCKYAQSSSFSLFQEPLRLLSTLNALGNFHKPLFSCFKSSQFSHRIAQQFIAIS